MRDPPGTLNGVDEVNSDSLPRLMKCNIFQIILDCNVGMEGNQAAGGHTPFMVAGPSAEAVETLAMMDWESFLPASSCRLASLLSGCSFPGLFRILRLCSCCASS